MPTGKAPYNADISPDGQYMVVTYKGNPAHEILERVYNYKEVNNREKYDAYQYVFQYVA